MIDHAHSDTKAALHKTPLHALHLECGARMVPFAGYSMPVQYPRGIIAEHRQTRIAASLFDCSHMGQAVMTGAATARQLEGLAPADIIDLPPGRQRYTVFTADDGGVLDDLMVTRLDDEFLLVVNAGRREADFALLEGISGRDCVLAAPDRALLALQGPQAATVLGDMHPAVRILRFLDAGRFDIDGTACIVSRSGYTGEDGFEISLAADDADSFARRLLEYPAVEPAGLGARDSLRLEAGLCLYGADLDADTSPIEAALDWVIARQRRPGGARAGGFPGQTRIFDQLAHGPSIRRVGLRAVDRAPVRSNTPLEDENRTRVGQVTSGGFGPTVNAPVAMGMVAAELAHPGVRLYADVRGRSLATDVVALPFVPHRYVRR